MLILGRTTENVLVVEKIERSQKHSSVIFSETWGQLTVLCDLVGNINLGIVGQLTEAYKDPIHWEFVPKQFRFAYMNAGVWYVTNKLPEVIGGAWTPAEGAKVEELELDTNGTIPWDKSLFRRPKAAQGA